MARTWSNAKKTDDTSAAQRAKNRPSGLTAFVVLLTAMIILFISVMAYATYRTETHPPTERSLPNTQQPKDE